MKKIRFGIIGLGNMGSQYVRWIPQDKSRDFCLGAVCDIIGERASAIGGEVSVPHFTDAQAMYDSGLIDAVIIATPHYWHPPLAVRAARAGLHVLTDKPMASSVGPARAMIAECRKRKVALGVMFMHRTRTDMRIMKKMVDAGALGEIYRVSMTCSTWFRTQSYYDSGAWRGTWDGEGGGILMNQAPHSLDLFQWIGGMPRSLIARVSTRVHKIEVENIADAILDYGGGKTGSFYSSTADSPGQDRFAICGDKGTLVAEGGKLRHAKLKPGIARQIKTCPKGFLAPTCEWRDVPLTGDAGGQHITVIRAFAAHVLRGAPMIATGDDSIQGLELCNAIYLAGYGNKEVAFPVDADAIRRLVVKLEKDRSSGRGGGLRAKAQRELKALGVKVS